MPKIDPFISVKTSQLLETIYQPELKENLSGRFFPIYASVDAAISGRGCESLDLKHQ
jgi:hypothetical protein